MDFGPEQMKASAEVLATKQELEAALLAFDGALWRADAARLNRATEAAHAALQAHLDAKAANLAVAKKGAGW